MTTKYRGLPAASGIGTGVVFVYKPFEVSTGASQRSKHSNPWTEWQTFLSVQAKVDEELEQVGQVTSILVADILSGQRSILHDKTLLDAIRSAIYRQGATAFEATKVSIAELVELFRSMGDDYFSGRATDIVDVGQRLLEHLASTEFGTHQLSQLPDSTILVADDLTISDMTNLALDRVRAIALVHGTTTSHATILARSHNLPLVCKLDAEILDISPDTPAIVDGNTGDFLLNPTAEEIALYKNANLYLVQANRSALEQKSFPAITRDGLHIPIYANINNLNETSQAFDQGADGVGMLRSEYFFLAHQSPPTVREHAEIYTTIANTIQERMKRRYENDAIHTALHELKRKNIHSSHLQVEHFQGNNNPTENSQPDSIFQILPPLLTIRALDMGGDKLPLYIEQSSEKNPFLGCRGIRLLLANPDLLRNQLDAVLSSTREGVSIRFMLPMVTTLDEVRQVRKTLLELSQLEQYQSSMISLGVLIEVPAAALMAEHLAQEVDFFSIGTNDLTQYVLALDRNDTYLTGPRDMFHPAILQLISLVCHTGHIANMPVSICGEMASNPNAVPLLLGLGVTELSVAPAAIPLVKQSIRQSDMMSSRQLAEQALQCRTIHEVWQLINPKGIVSLRYDK